jgi:hypothetical protein
MIMASVQFYGAEKAIEAYVNCNIPAWGLFSGRQLLCKYQGTDINEGKALLEEFINKIEESNATYTLKVFESEKGKGVRIKEKTECDSSFNFKIDEQEVYMQRQNQRGYGREYRDKTNGELLEAVQGLNERLNQLEEPIEEEEEEEFDLNKEIIGMIREPNRLIQFISAINSAKNLFTGRPTQYPPPAVVGNTSHATETNDDLLVRLSNAIDTLEKADPLIVQHLEKLAQLSINNRMLFDMMIKQLDSLK